MFGAELLGSAYQLADLFAGKYVRDTPDEPVSEVVGRRNLMFRILQMGVHCEPANRFVTGGAARLTLLRLPKLSLSLCGRGYRRIRRRIDRNYPEDTRRWLI